MKTQNTFTARPQYIGETVSAIVIYADDVPMRSYSLDEDAHSDISGDHVQAIMRGWIQDRAALADLHRLFRERIETAQIAMDARTTLEIQAAWDAQARKLNVRQVAEDAIAYTRAYYDEEIFPPRPPGRHSEVYDGEAAAVARLTCDNILREFRKRMEDDE